MSRIYIGLPQLEGKLTSYAKRYDLVEVRPLDTPLPKPSALRRWREQAPPAFAFSVVLPQAVSTFDRSGGFEPALNLALETATALQAVCLVLATPPSLRPTQANRQRIIELAEKLPRGGQVLAWQPSGMWEPADVLATAAAAGYVPVFDAAQEPLGPGPVAYTRIRALGHAGRIGAGRIARIAEQLAERRLAYVVVDATIARKVKAGLGAALEQLPERRAIPAIFRRGDDLVADDEEQ
jgi:uncharacterized protein YecE (DUF72 family)